MNLFEKEELQAAFATSLLLPPRLEPRLRAALTHTLHNAGSLVRPQIVLQMSGAYRLPREHAKSLAIALEYFHTASLIFDDLPCMDNAVERRGGPCAHMAFGESGAILAALALINRAYSLTWQAAAACSPERQARALAYLEEHLGVGGLLNGQSLDLHYFLLPHDLQTTERIALGKTVPLIELTLVLPAILGGAPAGELRLLGRIARFWGLGYQIVDDLKDVLQGAAETGKTVSRDGPLDRPNMAIAIGVPAAMERLTRLITLGDKALRRLVLRRPAVAFLGVLRTSLQQEMARMTQGICTNTTRGGA